MVYVKHKYGTRKKEIKSLLHKRLNHREKIRYYSKKLEKYQSKLKEVEDELETLFSLAKGEVPDSISSTKQG